MVLIRDDLVRAPCSSQRVATVKRVWCAKDDIVLTQLLSAIRGDVDKTMKSVLHEMTVGAH